MNNIFYTFLKFFVVFFQSKKKFSENNYICNLTTVRVSDVMGWWLDLIMNKLTPHAIAAQHVVCMW